MASQLIKNKFITISVLIICTLISLYYAFANRYPLIFPDIYGYINHGFSNTLSLDKPHTYSFFIRHLSLKESLWLVIFVQGFILSFIIYKFLQKFEVSNPISFL